MSCNAEELDLYNAYVNTLFDQWLRRETWCAVMGSVPDRQRRHYPESGRHQIRLCGGYTATPYLSYNRNPPVYFPAARRVYPQKKNISNLQGYF